MKIKGGDDTVVIPTEIYEKLERKRLERVVQISPLWRDWEIEVLTRFYNLVPIETLMESLPKRSFNAIRSKAGEMKKTGTVFEYMKAEI